MATARPTILITGAAGYVGSHCLVELLKNDFECICIDNCSNAIHLPEKSLPESIERCQLISGRKIQAFYKEDINNTNKLIEIFRAHRPIDAVIHFAALKAVGESSRIPLDYYHNNVAGTITLLNVMKLFDCKKFIFSSSATVYGRPNRLPIDENHSTGIGLTNPYGRTKFMVEEILQDLCRNVDDRWSILSLRYFNPIGAHESGEIGEDPQDIPNNLMPYLSQVAVKRLSCLKVFGNDFNTADGTGVRDYIHVMDLANGHLLALKYLLSSNHGDNQGWNVFNFGAGTGYSVLDVIKAFEQSNQIRIPYTICSRRAGDIDELWADISKASTILKWKPRYSLRDMCSHTWKWQSKYPMGYRTHSAVVNDQSNLINTVASNTNDTNNRPPSATHNGNKAHQKQVANRPTSPPSTIALKSIDTIEKLIFKHKHKHLYPFEVNNNNDEDILV